MWKWKYELEYRNGAVEVHESYMAHRVQILLTYFSCISFLSEESYYSIINKNLIPPGDGDSDYFCRGNKCL